MSVVLSEYAHSKAPLILCDRCKAVHYLHCNVMWDTEARLNAIEASGWLSPIQRWLHLCRPCQVEALERGER